MTRLAAVLSLALIAAAVPVRAAAVDAGALICLEDEAGAAIPGAALALDGVLSRREAVTRADGCALFSPLTPGFWDVTAEAPERSMRIRIGLRLDPGVVSRLDLILPIGDEIITDTDDRVLPDLSAGRPLTRTYESLVRRPGDNDIDAVLSELPTASHPWVSSFPLTIVDPRTYSGLPPSTRRVRLEDARLDGILNRESNLEWLDPAAIGGVVADDTEGTPTIQLLPQPPLRANGALGLAFTDHALQSSGDAGIEDFTQIRARFGTPLIAEHAALDASWSRSSGTIDDVFRRQDRVVEGWHLRSVGRWGDRQSSRLLVVGGREQRMDHEELQRSGGTTTSVLGIGHQYYRPLWSLEVSGSRLRASADRGLLRKEEDGENARLELVRILSTAGSDHEFHLVVEEQRNELESALPARRTTAADFRDRWIGGRFTADLGVRWSRREIAGSEANSFDPYVDIAARVSEARGTVLLLSAGSRALDAIDVTGGDPEEALRYGVVRVTQPLGEWTVGEIGVGHSELSDGVVEETAAVRSWLSVRRRYSSGYAVRGFARWGELQDSPGADAWSGWSAGGELTVELPSGWGMAVAGDLRDERRGSDEDLAGNVDIRLSRGITMTRTMRLALWTELRNALDANGIAWESSADEPMYRQPRTVVLGGSLEF